MLRKLKKIGFKELRFSTGEVEMNYVMRPSNRLALVLIPGQVLSWESYQRVLSPLSRKFAVFAVDIRGHGKSSWTPGSYSFPSIGSDMLGFLKHIVRQPAIISGNSSGGLIALWLAANVPDQVLGIILEDAPVFSAEWPRLRDDCYVYRVFKHNTETIGAPTGRNLAAFYKDMEIPVQGGQLVLQSIRWMGSILSGIIRIYQFLRPGRPVDILLLPPEIRLLTKCLSIYDPDFTRAFVDGSACRGFDHADALARVKCPMLLLHANWFRHPKFGLVGSMDNSDVARVRSLATHCQYKRIASGHMIHFENPDKFVQEVEAFAVQFDEGKQQKT